MTDRPILMSAPMVRALLDGRKTQTRRLAWKRGKLIPITGYFHGEEAVREWHPTIWQSVKPGDRLYVRETWGAWPHMGGGIQVDSLRYRADQEPPDDPHSAWQWRPSIHLPRRHSRLTLIVTATKMERVQDISEDNAVAEGCDGSKTVRQMWLFGSTGAGRAKIIRSCAPSDYRQLWGTLHTKLGALWGDNPEVVALTFTVHQQNIDAMGKAA